MNFNIRMDIAQCTTIMSNGNRYTSESNFNSLNSTKFVGGFIWMYFMWYETTLSVIKKTEILLSLFNSDNI